jgi:hypothetical protein
MARSIHRLSAAKVKNAKAGKRRDGTPRVQLHADGGGLYLQVTPGNGSTSKSWIYRYATAAGNERFIGSWLARRCEPCRRPSEGCRVPQAA